MTGLLIGGMRFVLDLSQSLWEQVVEQVRSAVAKGEIGLGERVPSVRDLAQALQINPNTVMRAYQELEREGLTETRRGQGTFVTASAESVAAIRRNLADKAVEEFATRMQSLGFSWGEMRAMVEERGEHRR